MSGKGELYSKSIILILVSLCCQAVNLIRDIILSDKIGAGSINDIYLTSQTVISLMITAVNSPMATAYVPVAANYFVNKSKEERNSFLGIVYSDISIAASVLSVIAFVIADIIIAVAAPGFSETNRNLLKIMFRLQLPLVFVNLIKGVNKGNFQIMQKFNISEITNVLPYFCMIIYMSLVSVIDIKYVAIVLSLGGIVSLLIEIFYLKKNQIKPKFRPAINNDIKAILKLMVGSTAATVIREVNLLCDKSVGSLLEEGSITRLAYSSRTTVVMVGLVSSAISIVGFSNIAKYKAAGENDKISSSVQELCDLTNFIIIPISFYLILFSDTIINILFGRGAFTQNDVLITGNLVKIYAVGLIGYGFQDVFTRSLHAVQIISSTVKGSAIIVSVNIVLNLVLYRFIGAYGVALASTIAVIVVIPFYYKEVKKNIGCIQIKEGLKILLASAITYAVGYVLKQRLAFLPLVPGFVAESLICAVAYFALAALFKFNMFFGLINEIIHRRKK